MDRKQLIWISLLVMLFAGIPPLIYAQTQDTSAYTAGWNAGYRTGYESGRIDHNNGSKFDAVGAPGYKDYRSSYKSTMGDKSHFEKGYKTGFRLGYEDGYSGAVSRIVTPVHPSQMARVETEPAPNAYSAGWNEGYKNGYSDGKTAQINGSKLDVSAAPGYKGYRSSYHSSMGSRDQYKKGYQSGFDLGYKDGYSGVVSRIVSPAHPSRMARAETRPAPNAYSSGWDEGYRNGYCDGKTAHHNGLKMDADDAPNYNGYRSSYRSSMGSRDRYEKGYKTGFELGYKDGYSGVISRLATPPYPPSAAAQRPACPPGPAAQAPRALPRTGSDLPLLALIGLIGIGLSAIFRVLRYAGE